MSQLYTQNIVVVILVINIVIFKELIKEHCVRRVQYQTTLDFVL